MDGRTPGPAPNPLDRGYPHLNLLLHFELAARDLGIEGAAGALLPDFWRMADARARVSTRSLPYDGPLDDRARPLARGVLHHLVVDRLFHQDESLLGAGQRRAAEVLRRSNWPRPGLLAHPAWELALDGALIRSHGADYVIDRLRQGVATLERPVLDALASGYRLPCRAEPTFREQLIRLLERLHHGEWPRGYADPEGLARRLAGLARRVGLAIDQASARGFEELLERAGEMLPTALALHPEPEAFASGRLTTSAAARA